MLVLALLVYEALATSVRGLKLLVYEALATSVRGLKAQAPVLAQLMRAHLQCMRPSATSV